MSIITNKVLHYGTKINLNIAELYIAERPAMIKTVLGSCLAIVFYSKRLRVGAIAHVPLPEQKSERFHCSNTYPVKYFTDISPSCSFKYVSCVFPYMVEKFRKLGVKNNEIDVKLFGGASVLEHNHNMKTVGRKNLEIAFRMIKDFDLNLVNKNIGGSFGRTIHFFTDTGEVYIRHLKNNRKLQALFVASPDR